MQPKALYTHAGGGPSWSKDRVPVPPAADNKQQRRVWEALAPLKAKDNHAEATGMSLGGAQRCPKDTHTSWPGAKNGMKYPGGLGRVPHEAKQTLTGRAAGQ